MKWIGQHIVNLISRFRSSVYLEDIDTGTIASGGNLGLDANNKVVKNTVSGGGDFEVTGDSGTNQTIEAGNTLDIAGGNAISTVVGATDTVTVNHDNTSSQANVNNSGSTYIQDMELDTYGHVTSITSTAAPAITIDDTSAASNEVELGDTITISGATGIATAWTGDTLRIASSAATTDAVGVVELATTAETTAGTDTSRVVTPEGLEDGYQGSTNVVTLGTITTGVWSGTSIATARTDAKVTSIVAGDGIDINSGTGDVTVTAETATDSNPGVVELATTGEADTGTDTARAVTPAGLKSHVDARYAYQYISFSFKANNIPSDCWMTPSQQGPEYYLWNNPHGSGQTQASSGAPSAVDTSATISVDYLDQPSAFVIPQACKLVGFRGNCRTNGTNPNTLRPVVALFRAAEPSDGNTSDVTATCVAFDKYDTASGNRRNRFLMLTTSVDVDLAQGDLLFPAAGFDATASDGNGDLWGSFTLILKTLVP